MNHYESDGRYMKLADRNQRHLAANFRVHIARWKNVKINDQCMFVLCRGPLRRIAITNYSKHKNEPEK